MVGRWARLGLALAIEMGLCCASAGATEVKFLTYNVEAPGWNPARRTQVVGAIGDEAPDVLGLHEARPGGNGADLEADLSADYEPHHTGTNDPIYLRRDRLFVVLDEGVVDLPVCPELMVGAATLTWVKVQTPEGHRFDFYNTHLCVTRIPGGQVNPEGNQLQAVAAAEFIAANTEIGTTHLLAGDLNAGAGTPTMLYLLGQQDLVIDQDTYMNPVEYDDTWDLAPGNAGMTKPSTAVGGNAVIDWILSDPQVDVVDAEVVQFNIPPGDEDEYSDHFPVSATLFFEDGPAVFEVSLTSLTPGEEATISIVGAAPNSQVVIHWTRGGVDPDQGPCPIEYGGLCLDLVGNVRSLPERTVDGNGILNITRAVPTQIPPGTVAYAQVVNVLGAGGVDSVKSNVVSEVVQ